MPSFADLPPRHAKGELRVVVETPRGSNIKFDFDVGIQAFGISKVLNAG